MRKRPTIILLVVATCVLIASFARYDSTRFTCLECRATLENRSIVGIPIQWICQNSYSTLVLADNDSHMHEWRWCGTNITYSLSSYTRGSGRQHPIWKLPIKIQAEYAGLVPASELKASLEEIDSEDDDVAEIAVQEIYETVLNAR